MSFFTAWLGCLGFLMLFALSVPGAGSAEAPPRAPLDAQEHMRLGSAATIYVDESGQRTVSIPRTPFDEQRGVVSGVESAAITTYGIQVARLMSVFCFGATGDGSCKEDSSHE